MLAARPAEHGASADMHARVLFCEKLCSGPRQQARCKGAGGCSSSWSSDVCHPEGMCIAEGQGRSAAVGALALYGFVEQQSPCTCMHVSCESTGRTWSGWGKEPPRSSVCPCVLLDETAEHALSHVHCQLLHKLQRWSRGDTRLPVSPHTFAVLASTRPVLHRRRPTRALQKTPDRDRAGLTSLTRVVYNITRVCS